MSDEFADEELAAFIGSYNSLNLPPAAVTGVEALRAATLERAAARPRGRELAAVRDTTISPEGPNVRLYRPSEGETSVVVFFHGGGGVIGDLETHDRACRLLAAAADVCIVAVDYRRAPEHPWPAAIDDAVAAVAWVASGPAVLGPINGTVGLAGDSAGGTIAALASQRLRREAPELVPAAQFLLYPNTDLSGSGETMETKGHGFGLERADIAWFAAQCVPDPAVLTDPSVSPLFATDLTGLPPTFLVTCEHDPLRDQGEAYAGRLTEAGVPTVLRREAGMVHNFLLWDLVSPACAAAINRVASDIRSATR